MIAGRKDSVRPPLRSNSFSAESESSHMFGLPVAQSTGRALYLAMDRPRQAARSMLRMVMPEHREVMIDHVVVWKGPTGVDLLSGSSALADGVESRGHGIDLVVLNSLKDLASNMSDGETGAAINSAWQELIARGVQILILHHERRSADGSSRGSSLDAIYGSTWLTSGLGSVIALSETQGDPELTMNHLKQPAEEVGPFEFVHDHRHGVTTLIDRMTAASFLTNNGTTPRTVKEIAEATGEPRRPQDERSSN